MLGSARDPTSPGDHTDESIYSLTTPTQELAATGCLQRPLPRPPLRAMRQHQHRPTLLNRPKLLKTNEDRHSVGTSEVSYNSYNTNDPQACLNGIHRLQQTLGTYIDPEQRPTNTL